MTHALVEVSHTLARAIADRDAATLNQILSDDFIHIAFEEDASAPHDKKAFVDAVLGASYEITDLKVDRLQVHESDDVAVVTGAQTAAVKLPDGRRLTATSSFTDVFRSNEGRWRLWLAHSTDVSTC